MGVIQNIITINDFNYSQGGASKVAIDTANLICKSGIKSIFISAVSDDDKSTLDKDVIQYKYNGIEFLHYNNKLKGMLNGIQCKSFSCFVKQVLQNFNSNDTIVHVHGWTKACSSDFFNTLYSMGFRTVLTLHEYFTFCPNGAYFDYKKNTACHKKGCSMQCFFCNCDSRNYVFKLYRFFRELKYKKDIDFRKIYAIYISKFEKKVIEKQLIVPNSTIIENPVTPIEDNAQAKEYDYVFIGRTTNEKGVALFVKLAEQMKENKFLLVGDYKSSLKNLFITGWVSEKEVDMYLAKSKVLVFPSLWPETFGLNVVKALSVGIPCLVSSNTAAEDYVINGKNGFVFQQGDFDDLKKKAITTCSETDICLKKNNSFNRLISFYETILSSRTQLDKNPRD